VLAAAAAARAAPGMRLSRWRRTWIHFLRRPTTGDTMKKFSVLRTPAHTPPLIRQQQQQHHTNSVRGVPGVCLELYEGSSLIRCHLIFCQPGPHTHTTISNERHPHHRHHHHHHHHINNNTAARGGVEYADLFAGAGSKGGVLGHVGDDVQPHLPTHTRPIHIRVCRVSCVVCRVSCVVCRVSCVVCRVSCVVCRVSCGTNDTSVNGCRQ
jgi:hypothetical protein